MDYNRRDVVEQFADKKGAHLDEVEGKFHLSERQTVVHINGLSLSIGSKYLVDIAGTVLYVCGPVLADISNSGR